MWFLDVKTALLAFSRIRLNTTVSQYAKAREDSVGQVSCCTLALSGGVTKKLLTKGGVAA